MTVKEMNFWDKCGEFALQRFIKFIIFAAICSGNGMLLLTILITTSLRERKEMLIIAGLATADIIFGSGAGLLAAYRVFLMITGMDQQRTTPFLCLITPVFLTHIGGQLTSVMNVAVSLDRFIAVAKPAKYRALGRSYSIKLLACVGLYATISMLIMFSGVYFGMDDIVANSNFTLTRMCSGIIFPNWFLMFEQTFDLTVSLSGVLIYVGVYMAYRRGTRLVASLARDTSSHAAAQHRLTVTLGIITCSTFIFFVIPYSAFTLFAWLRLPTPYVILWGTMSRISTIINITIYVYRQKEVRSAMFKILTCKTGGPRQPTGLSSLNNR